LYYNNIINLMQCILLYQWKIKTYSFFTSKYLFTKKKIKMIMLPVLGINNNQSKITIREMNEKKLEIYS